MEISVKAPSNFKIHVGVLYLYEETGLLGLRGYSYLIKVRVLPCRTAGLLFRYSKTL